MWTRRFNADRRVLGKSITLNGKEYRVDTADVDFSSKKGVGANRRLDETYGERPVHGYKISPITMSITLVPVGPVWSRAPAEPSAR